MRLACGLATCKIYAYICGKLRIDMNKYFVALIVCCGMMFAACSQGSKDAKVTTAADSVRVENQPVAPGENVALTRLDGGNLAVIEWKSLGRPDSVCVFYIDAEGNLWDTNVQRIGREWRNVADTAAMSKMIPESISDTARQVFNPDLFTAEAALVRSNLIPLNEIRDKATIAEKRQVDEVIGLIKAATVSSFPADFFAEPLKSLYGKHAKGSGSDKVYLAVKLPDLGTDECEDFSTPLKDFKINGIDFEKGKVDYTFKSVIHDECDGGTSTRTTNNAVWVTRRDGRLLIAKSADEGYVFVP